MAEIHYALAEGRGEWTDVKTDGRDELTLLFTPPTDGHILVEGTVYRVKCGSVKLPMKGLPDKEYGLRLEANGKGYNLEKFTKLNNEISMAKTDEAAIRALMRRCRLIEEKLCGIDANISTVLERTEGHRIFN